MQLDTARVLGLRGAPNFRDLGGYETTDGRHLRWGIVYRSNKLSALTRDDEAKVERLHIAAEIDLRTQEEREHEPSLWLHPPADVYQSPKESLGPVLKSVLHNAGTAEAARGSLEQFYARIPDLYRDEYTALFRRLAAGARVLLFFCTAGKDRTGVAAAILLSALGVPRETVIADYVLTNTLLPLPPRLDASAPGDKLSPALAALNQLPEDVRVQLWRADDSYIAAALNAIDQHYGSVAGYLKTGLGLSDDDISGLRNALLT